jgi:hypothetical protein
MSLDYMYLVMWALGLAIGYYAYAHFAATGKAY